MEEELVDESATGIVAARAVSAPGSASGGSWSSVSTARADARELEDDDEDDEDDSGVCSVATSGMLAVGLPGRGAALPNLRGGGAEDAAAGLDRSPGTLEKRRREERDDGGVDPERGRARRSTRRRDAGTGVEASEGAGGGGVSPFEGADDDDACLCAMSCKEDLKKDAMAGWDV